MFTLGSLFSGIGGLDLAAHWAGFSTQWFVEKEPFCQKVLAKHWAGVPIYGDIFDCHYLPHVDVICGGFPCQPFSVAGPRKGAADERFLLPDMMRVIEEVKPYAVLFENVPGFPSLSNGNEFKKLLWALAEMGFDAEWGHIRASDIGAPHTRERWFMVAYMVNAKSIFSDYQRKSNAGKQEQTIYRAANKRDGGESLHAEELAHATSARFQGRNSQELQHAQLTGHIQELGHAGSGGFGGIKRRGDGSESTERYKGQEQGKNESRLGRIIDGLPKRVDFVGFPSRPYEKQKAYEPPYTAPTNWQTRSRIKALGNAVVPQCAYPIFAAIAEWLEEIKKESEDEASNGE